MATNGDAPTEQPTPMECDPTQSSEVDGAVAAESNKSADAGNGGAADPLADSATSDSDDEPDPKADEPAKSSSKTPEEKLIKAVSYKDRGNKCIAEGDSAGALKHYERGIKIASGLSSDEQAKALLVSLRLNLALACTKEERFGDAAAAATKVLEVDPANVKALFRRGVARARIGMFEDAKADLMAVVKADPRNGGAKKELKVLRERLVEHRQKEKASYTGLFDKGPMYNDKELERQKREAEAAKRLKEEQEEWSKDNEKRKAEGEEEQTLEDWRKARKEAEEQATKEQEENEKLKPRPPPPTRPASPPKKESADGEDDGNEMELDEEDLKIIQDTKKQGYCYFKRTLSEKDQSLLDAEQMKLRARVAPSAIPETGEEPAAVNDATRSAWNEAGTWEEVEKTDWCKERITQALGGVAVSAGKDMRDDPSYLMEKLGGFDFSSVAGEDSGGKGLEVLGELKRTLAKLSAAVTNVEIIGGDAHVICVSNKIKHIFDFNVKLKFSLEIDESMGLPPAEGAGGKAAASVKSYEGTLTFPDMTNNDVDNGRFDSEPELKWDKKARWEAAYTDRADACVTDLKAGILAALGSFFTEYKNS